MSAVAERGVEYGPIRDKSYQQTRLGPSVVDFLAWKETGGTADSTRDQYERDLARGCLLYPNHALEDFTDAELLQIARTFKPKERRVRVAAYRSFFRFALKTRRITVNPCDGLPDIERTKQRAIDVFSDEEIAVLCDLPLRDGALMQLLFDSGLRKGEARRFKLAHLRAGEVVVFGGKGGKDRVIPASPDVLRRVNELALLEGLGPTDHLWYGIRKTIHVEKTMRATPIGEGTFARWWKRCLIDAGVRKRNPHTTRHTFATRYLRNGGSLSLLSDAMGHASIKTTDDTYSHLDTRDLREEFARVFQSTEA